MIIIFILILLIILGIFFRKKIHQKKNFKVVKDLLLIFIPKRSKSSTKNEQSKESLIQSSFEVVVIVVTLSLFLYALYEYIKKKLAGEEVNSYKDIDVLRELVESIKRSTTKYENLSEEEKKRYEQNILEEAEKMQRVFDDIEKMFKKANEKK